MGCFTVQPLVSLLMALSLLQLTGLLWCAPPVSVEVEPDLPPGADRMDGTWDSQQSAEEASSSNEYDTSDSQQSVDEASSSNDYDSPDPPGDGSFNGVDIYYRNTPPTFHSEARCIGDNFRNDAWQSRSCEFRNLCFNTETKKYVLFQSPKNKRLGQTQNNGMTFSTTLSEKSVAIGSFSGEQIEDHGFEKMRWFPEIEDELPESYYELPSDYVLVPFHGLAPHNPGHLIWDNFLPIHTLLSTFQLQTRRLLLMRVVLERGLFGTCEAAGQEQWLPEACEFIIHKFLDLMGPGVYESFSSSENFNVTQNEAKSNYVCAKTGVAGIGMLTDHGVDSHGFWKSDYDNVHFAGSGPLIYAFRTFAMNNMGLDEGAIDQSSPLRITFSVNSSGHPMRGTAFGTQIKAVKRAYSNNDNVIVQSFCFADFTPEEQMEIASESAIFISAVGGGAVTATFLSRGASAIMYYNREVGVRARLDWEVLNNAGYFTTNWLQIEKRNTKDGLAQLLGIIDLELDRIADM